MSKNNTTAKTLLHLEENSTITSTNNLVFTTGADVVASLNAVNKTWSEWVNLGYDANSYNANPNFADTTAGLYYCVEPTNSLNTGYKLSGIYANGIDIMSTFPFDVTLRSFGKLHDIGAYAMADTRIFMPTNKVLTINGAILKLDY